jgi:hypothetical protein
MRSENSARFSPDFQHLKDNSSLQQTGQNSSQKPHASAIF